MRSVVLCFWLILAVVLCQRVHAEEPSLWFPVPERLEYSFDWGLIAVAKAEVTAGWRYAEGGTQLLLRTSVRSNRWLDRMFPVDDRMETMVDPADFLPAYFYKHMKEGGQQLEEITMFDRAVGRVRWHSLMTGLQREWPAPADMRDIVTLMYQLRRSHLSADMDERFTIAGDNGPAVIRIRGLRHDAMKVEGLGRVSAVVLQPEVGDDALFLGRVPREVWVSTDDRRVLLRMSMDAAIGRFTMYLVRYSTGGDVQPDDSLWRRLPPGR